MIHIRIQQRNGRKTLTSVQGLSEQYDLKYVLLSYYRACIAISFFISEKLSKSVSVISPVTVPLLSIPNTVKLSSFKVFLITFLVQH